MRCMVCDMDFQAGLMLARHVLRSPGHDKLASWAESQVEGLRSVLQASALASAKLTQAMNDGWDSTGSDEQILKDKS